MSFEIYRETSKGWKKNDRLPEFLEMVKALEDNPGSYAVTDMERMHLYYLMRRTNKKLYTKLLDNGKVEVFIPPTPQLKIKS